MAKRKPAKKAAKKPARKVVKKAPKRVAKKPAKKPASRPAKKAAQPEQMPKPCHGSFMWNELMTRDDDGAVAFFEKLLGWTHLDWPMGPNQPPYRIMKAGGVSVAGMMKMAEPQFPSQIPAHWMAYIAVDNVDMRYQKALSLGGEGVHPPMDIPQVGRFCLIKDPTGAIVALMTPEGGVS